MEVCLLDQIYCEILYLIPLVDKLLVIFPSPLWDRTDPEETPTCIRSIQVYEFPFAIQFLRRRNRKHNQLSDCLNWFNKCVYRYSIVPLFSTTNTVDWEQIRNIYFLLIYYICVYCMINIRITPQAVKYKN